jgi:hypothetical protein
LRYAVVVAREHGLALEPPELQPVMAGEAHQVVRVEREAPLAHALGGALEVGEVVARHLLVRADQQVRELPAGGAGLGKELRDRRLQHIPGEQERGLERHAGGAAAAPAARGRRRRGIAAVEEPARLALEDAREQRQHLLRRHALAALDHREVGDRGGPARVLLDAARRELLQGEAVALAQGAQLGAEEVALAGVRGHGRVKLTV